MSHDEHELFMMPPLFRGGSMEIGAQTFASSAILIDPMYAIESDVGSQYNTIRVAIN